MSEARLGRGLWLFFGLLIALCTAAYVPVLREHSLRALGGYALPLLMWAPGIAGICTSLIVFRSLRPCGFGLSRKAVPWLLAAFAIPLLYTLVIQGLLRGLGLVQLGTKNLSLVYVVSVLPISLLYSSGEEIGWRGFFTPLMIERFGFVRGNLLIGLLWAAYHVPAMLFAGYAHGPGSRGMLFFLVTVIALSFFLCTMRLESRSVWPSALLHAAHNLFFLHLFDPVTNLSPSAAFFQGETGLLLVLVMVGLGVWSLRRHALAPALARGAEARSR